jgi:hypothetical protein
MLELLATSGAPARGRAGAGSDAEEGEGAAGVSQLAGSSVVDKEKWHHATVSMLRVLASAMTGPVPVPEGKAAGKKRKASAGAGEIGSLASVADGGSLADTTRGKGSAADPVSFHALSEHADTRIAARSFFELLVLKSWDIITVQQGEAYGDILIARTERFAGALAEHT